MTIYYHNDIIIVLIIIKRRTYLYEEKMYYHNARQLYYPVFADIPFTRTNFSEWWHWKENSNQRLLYSFAHTGAGALVLVQREKKREEKIRYG